MQLKFVVFGDPLLEEEESRKKFIEIAKMPEPDKPQSWVKHAIYMLEIDFHKIKRICYQFDSEGSNEWLKMMIVMHSPANARKCMLKNANYVRSPLNMHSQNYFLNNWNTN